MTTSISHTILKNALHDCAREFMIEATGEPQDLPYLLEQIEDRTKRDDLWTQFLEYLDLI